MPNTALNLTYRKNQNLTVEVERATTDTCRIDVHPDTCRIDVHPLRGRSTHGCRINVQPAATYVSVTKWHLYARARLSLALWQSPRMALANERRGGKDVDLQHHAVRGWGAGMDRPNQWRAVCGAVAAEPIPEPALQDDEVTHTRSNFFSIARRLDSPIGPARDVSLVHEPGSLTNVGDEAARDVIVAMPLLTSIAPDQFQLHSELLVCCALSQRPQQLSGIFCHGGSQVRGQNAKQQVDTVLGWGRICTEPGWQTISICNRAAQCSVNG